MKFTKTLIVIAIVLGLLTACVVGCYADEVCYTTISQGGEQFINPNSFDIGNAKYSKTSNEIYGDNEIIATYRLWVIESINSVQIDGDLLYAMSFEYGFDNGTTETYYRFFVQRDVSDIADLPDDISYEVMQDMFTNDLFMIFETSVVTSDNYRIILNAETVSEYADLFGISYIEDNGAFGTEYVVTSTINYCLNTMKGDNEDMTVVEQVLAVFSAIGDWFAEIIPSMLSVFYSTETNTLTVIGVLAVCSLAIAVILLVLAWIVDFFKFRR